MLTLIAAIGKNREIGYKNKIPWKISEDILHFKAYTTGKVVVMGGNTFLSIGKILPGRKCIVLSKSETGHLAVHAKSINDVLSIEHCYPEIVIVGGESVYKQTIDIADKLVITHIDADFDADAFFPLIDMKLWKIDNIMDSCDKTYKYKFIEYIRNESIRNSKREIS